MPTSNCYYMCIKFNVLYIYIIIKIKINFNEFIMNNDDAKLTFL